MIKLKKKYPGPEVNNNLGQNKIIVESNNLNTLYDATPQSYINGINKFEFNNKVYGNKKIKKKLIKFQFGKCAFCEQNVLSVSDGDVEHFRPKGGFRQSSKNQLQLPGYYWLAYDWDNLLFSCSSCNRRFKKNLFPILDQFQRARNHHDDITNEKVVFVNPYNENPKFLIGFNKEVAYGKDKKNRGKKTIEALGLNREGDGFSDLLEIRRDYFDLIEQTYLTSKKTASAEISQNQIDKANVLMEKFRDKTKQFSAMVNENFPI